MEVDGSAARSGGAWPTLVDDASAETVSPRALLTRGPVTRPAKKKPEPEPEPDVAETEPTRARTPTGSEAVIEPAPAPALPSRHAVLRWRAGVAAVVLAAAAAFAIVTNEPAPRGHGEDPLAAVGAASPETATALAPSDDTEAKPVVRDREASAREALVEEVLYIEDDLDDPQPEAVLAAAEPAGAVKSASRANAREAARSLTAKARARRSSGDNAGAEKLYHDALGALPTYAPAAADLATLHIHRGDYKSALAYAKRAQRSAPRMLPYMVLLGDAYSLTGNDATARSWWRRAAEFGSTKAEDRLAKHGG